MACNLHAILIEKNPDLSVILIFIYQNHGKIQSFF
jgi:hypothetical protein